MNTSGYIRQRLLDREREREQRGNERARLGWRGLVNNLSVALVSLASALTRDLVFFCAC